ncbi:MAG: Dot/Icm secretion system ATPase DotB [Candidatus Aquirickettsiella gammari]|jgi:defect-in-organelle-trafficking protein DotB|uniref:Dot/Icm secretion system ATPase DotB n=1 Tax=Candidatus Aquirickettsiella gammari TaxID=2016198 RepID=A0A370CHF3_9COXI|nr:MAG: Dot/Icm secretion system ATPase DotB [Candidatus Aquirickettsiella gammari]
MTVHLLKNEPVRFTTAACLAQLLIHCQKLAASDITLQTGEPVFAEVYGRLLRITQRKLSNTEVAEILNLIYGPNGSAQILSGVDIDTHYEFRPNRNERYRFRVNATGCLVAGHDAIQISFRTIPSTPPKMSDLNLEPQLVDALAPAQGIVYVTGATGSGKTTLLAAIIRDLAEKTESHRKILSYEAPIEFVYDTITMPSAIISQSEIPRHLPSFAAGVRNALRRKPRLILVGEARDPETISASIEAALTGHPVYTTLHSNGVAETLRRLVNSFPADEVKARMIDIIETIRVVIWQQLVPSLDGKRIALREFLIFDEKLRDILLDSKLENISAITRHLLKEYGQPMSLDAKRKFDAGLISERDYKRLILRTELTKQHAGS